MTTARLRSRVNKLLPKRVDPANGNGHPTLVLCHREGEPEPPIPRAAPRCPQCGQPHVVFIEAEMLNALMEACLPPGSKPASEWPSAELAAEVERILAERTAGERGESGTCATAVASAGLPKGSGRGEAARSAR